MPAPEMPAGSTPESDQRAAYWRANLRVIAGLLLVWFVVTFGLVYFAREIDFTFFGWPFSFWVAAQGSLAIYGLIVWIYARIMAKLDARFGVPAGEG